MAELAGRGAPRIANQFVLRARADRSRGQAARASPHSERVELARGRGHRGTAPLVTGRLRGDRRDGCGPDLACTVEAVARGGGAFHGCRKSLLRELLRLHQVFEAAQILVIPYKGPLLARIAYGSFLRREYLDLDFAVEQKNIPETVAVLESAGYCPQFDPREAHAGQNGFAPGQYSFLSHPHKILAEFHTERTLRYFPIPIDFQDLTGRLMTVEIGGQRLRTFSIEDTLVMLCVHGAKHFWERLGWVLDIATLVAAQPVDWTLLNRIAAKMESTRVLHLGLYLAHDLFELSCRGNCGKRLAGTPRFKIWRKKCMNNTLAFRIPSPGYSPVPYFGFDRAINSGPGCATLASGDKPDRARPPDSPPAAFPCPAVCAGAALETSGRVRSGWKRRAASMPRQDGEPREGPRDAP